MTASLKSRAEAAAEELRARYESSDVRRLSNGRECTMDDVLFAKTASLLSELARAVPEWRPISEAPKDGRVVWACFHSDIYPALRPLRDDLSAWNGVQIALRHPGLAEDGFNVGWSIAAQVGNGGFPDEWIAGWMPLPPPPTEGGEG